MKLSAETLDRFPKIANKLVTLAAKAELTLERPAVPELVEFGSFAYSMRNDSAEKKRSKLRATAGLAAVGGAAYATQAIARGLPRYTNARQGVPQGGTRFKLPNSVGAVGSAFKGGHAANLAAIRNRLKLGRAALSSMVQRLGMGYNTAAARGAAVFKR